MHSDLFEFGPLLGGLSASPGDRNHAAWVISTGAVEIIEITQNPIKVIQILFFYSFLGDFYDFYGPGRNHVARLISVPPGPGALPGRTANTPTKQSAAL